MDGMATTLEELLAKRPADPVRVAAYEAQLRTAHKASGEVEPVRDAPSSDADAG